MIETELHSADPWATECNSAIVEVLTMKYGTNVVTLLLCCLVVGSTRGGELSTVARWKGLPNAIAKRWVASAHLQQGWTEVGFDQSKWASVKPLEAALYPSQVVDEGGGKHPIPEPIQWAFQPFWHPWEPSVNRWVYFRRVFDFTEAFAGCASYLSVDDEYEFYVNGVKVGSGSQDTVLLAKQFHIERYLKPGKNVLALAARNTGGPFHALIWTDLHQAFPVRRNQPMRWLCSLKEQKGWEQPDFVPRGWVKAVPVEFSPHFHLQGAINTTPIWHPGSQEQHGVVYFRFPFTIDGLPHAGGVEIAADNAWELYVNGQLAAIEKRHLNPVAPRSVEVSKFLHPGENLIAVKAYNYGGAAALACLPKVKVSF